MPTLPPVAWNRATKHSETNSAKAPVDVGCPVRIVSIGFQGEGMSPEQIANMSMTRDLEARMLSSCRSCVEGRMRQVKSCFTVQWLRLWRRWPQNIAPISLFLSIDEIWAGD
jgi:hypothetical protein